jgi:hypothetical protein
VAGLLPEPPDDRPDAAVGRCLCGRVCLGDMGPAAVGGEIPVRIGHSRVCGDHVRVSERRSEVRAGARSADAQARR